MRRFGVHGAIIAAACLSAGEARADMLSPWHYVKNYQLGFDVGDTTDSANLGFDTDPGDYYDPDCVESRSYDGMVTCELPFESRSSGYGLFFQQPFKRKGNWHIDYDLGLDVRVVDTKFQYAGEADPDSIPVYDLRLHLYSVVALPYVTFGYTPRNFPDLLISLGPSGELMWGSVNINNRRQIVSGRGVFRRSSVLSIFSYRELELVFARFGKGAASLTWWSLDGDDHVEDGDLLPEQVDGMYNLTMTTNKSFVGLKVVLK